jgi:hypothetical protein
MVKKKHKKKKKEVNPLDLANTVVTTTVGLEVVKIIPKVI